MKKCHFCGDDTDLYDFLCEVYYCPKCSAPHLLNTQRYRMYGHVQLRLKQRYKIDLTIGLYNEIVSQIRNRKLDTFIHRYGTSKKTIHRVVVEGKKIFVVYTSGNKKGLNRKGVILTVLPKKSFIGIPSLKIK